MQALAAKGRQRSGARAVEQSGSEATLGGAQSRESAHGARARRPGRNQIQVTARRRWGRKTVQVH